eukprot:5743955-Pleurochrysis_carterae.AAC.1
MEQGRAKERALKSLHVPREWRHGVAEARARYFDGKWTETKRAMKTSATNAYAAASGNSERA